MSYFGSGPVWEHMGGWYRRSTDPALIAYRSCMPRYFFDICDSKGFHRDEFGSECDDLDDARTMCQCLLPDINREELPDGESHAVTCDVRDGTGRVVYRGRITFEGTRDPAA